MSSLRLLVSFLVLGSATSFAQTRTKGVQFETRASIPCDPNTSCMWIDLTNRQVQFFDDTTPKTVPSIVTSSKGDMALFNGTKWEKLASDNVNGHVLTVDTTAATGWKVAAATGGDTLASTYNNGVAPADETMSIDNTKGPVKILDSLAGGPLFRVTFSDNVFQFIDVDSNAAYGVKLLFDGVNSVLSLGADALFNEKISFTLDNVFDIGSALVAAAHVFTRIVSAGANTLALIGNGDQVNLSSTGLDPNVDIVTTLGTIAKRFLSFAVKSGTIFYDGMLTSTAFGQGELLRGTNLTATTPGSGVAEYSPLLEFQQSFGETDHPENGDGSMRWAMQGRITVSASVSDDDRLVFLNAPVSAGNYNASPEYVFIKKDGVHAREFVSTSTAPTLSAGASGLLGTLTSTSVTGTNDAGFVSFTTGTVGAATTGNTAATAEILKITFAQSFTAPTGCVVEWYSMGTDSNVGAQNTAGVFSQANTNSRWGVCSTTTCSLYWNAPAGSGGWASTTAYKLGYKVSCF